MIVLPLKALHDAFGLRSVLAISYQAAGGAGQKGMDELAGAGAAAARRAPAIGGRRATRSPRSSIRSTPPRSPTHRPRLGSPAADGYSDEELKLVNESRKILELPDLRVSPTCVRVPVMVGHCIEVRATFERPPELAARTRRARGLPRRRARRAAHARRTTPAATRWRSAASAPTSAIPNSLNLFVVGDNLLKGAALNAVQIAELLVTRGLLGRRLAATA